MDDFVQVLIFNLCMLQSCRAVSCLQRLKMRYVAAAALAALGGGEVNEANIKKILSSVGIEADGEKVALVVKELAGKNLEEVIAAGTEKLGSVPSGGGAPAAAAPAAGGAAPAAAAAAAPPKKEESEEEEDDDMGFGLFD